MLTLKQILEEAKKNGITLADVRAEVNRQYAAMGGTKSQFNKLEIGPDQYQECKKTGKTLTQLLEELDPSANYEGVSLDAFERQLAVRGLNISGRQAVTLEEFYDPDNRPLFPEFIDREVKAGLVMGRHELADTDLIATETEIDSGTYENALVDMTGDFRSKIIPEGTKFPVITISIDEKTVSLQKHGALIKETYEHRRRIRANKMAVFLRLVGWYMKKDMAEAAVLIAINGNSGNSNSASSDTMTGLNYNNLVDFWAEFSPYESDTLIVPKAGLTAMLKINEFKDAMIAANWLTKGELITPLGHTLKRHDPTTSSVLANKVLGVDTRFCLEGLTEAGSYLVETDKIIDGQWNEIAISIVRGYAKIIAEAARVWDYS